MHCNYAMMFSKVTSPEVEGMDVDGVERDGAKWEEGAAESDCHD